VKTSHTNTHKKKYTLLLIFKKLERFFDQKKNKLNKLKKEKIMEN